MKLLVVHNPFANRWRAGRREREMRAALDAAGLTYELRCTSRPGEATEFASVACDTDAGHLQEWDAIVAAGGDGTVSEVLNGLLTAADGGPTAPFGILPIGTGNDFADMSGIPRDLAAAARLIASGVTRQVDAARIEIESDISPCLSAAPASGRFVRYFANNAGVGMEPLVTIEAARIRWLAGVARYGLALCKALWKLRAWRMRVAWDDGAYEGPALLASVCNSPRNGGMFPIAPAAEMDDGLLDLVLVPEVPKRTVAALLPRILRGTHVLHPRVTLVRTQRVTIECNPPTPLHADGEVLSHATSRIAIEVQAGRITLLAGPRMKHPRQALNREKHRKTREIQLYFAAAANPSYISC